VRLFVIAHVPSAEARGPESRAGQAARPEPDTQFNTNPRTQPRFDHPETAVTNINPVDPG